ncbi:disease resistance protein RPV1-like [Quercus robur]|uniref:disease resistance protein RPV1-like n=1 Tax=Quercus robur TaxID=38942 RepID=UPI00216211F1|nr:disease resistance protein RPV1-like [Quercus robur]
MLELESSLAFWLKDEVRFIGIWAMGGMGKTTLAEVAYKMFSKEFEACCFIENVREKYEKKGELSLQKNLISQILNDRNLNIKNKCEVEQVIQNRLRGKRIFLVLDDVNDLNQLQKLAGKREWFGPGSRIIITTRDKHLLETHLIDKIYEVKALKNEGAFHLFYSKAFKNKLVPDEYLELSKGFLNYVGGHPLALTVLGSFLYKRSVVEWENEFQKLKEHPKPNVIRVLKISYDGLDGQDQEIFKDIACFFNRKKKDYVVQILKNHLGRYPFIGLSNLIDKSLLKISKYNELWMHNLVEDMGRGIVRQESPEPGERSRLWLYKDIDHVLKNNTGTGNVQAIDIEGARDTRIYHEEKEACCRPQMLAPLLTLQGWVWTFTSSKKPEGLLWNPKAFLKMHNLKFLRLCSISLQLDTLPLPNNLSYLECNDYPLKSLHSLPAGLVELRLPRSKIELLWRGKKIFRNLKSINMDGSSDLITSANFNGVQNLEELVLARCPNLRELHPSIGKLKKLKLLDLQECPKLTSLPDKFEMESLVTLNLTHCLKVKKIPEFVGNMDLLQELLLEGTAIIELPSSVECLTSLNILILHNCKNLVCLPNTICSLTLLKNLDLFGCLKFDKLPEDLGNLVSLKKLDLSGTAIKELPSSVEFLIGLTSLDLTDCKNFVLLPSTICSLKSLDEIILSRCSKFDKLPGDLGNIISLKKLDLSRTAIKKLPSSVEFLIGLTSLDLTYCKKFDKLPEDLGNIVSLKKLCLRGTAIKELPSSVEFLIGLTTLDLRCCKEFVLLPSTICSLKSLDEIFLSGCSKFDKLPKDLGNIVSLKKLNLSGTAIKELPSSVEFLIGLTTLDLTDCKEFVLLPSTVCSLKSLDSIQLSGTAIKELPSSIEFLIGLTLLSLRDCKKFELLPSTVCSLKSLNKIWLSRCPKFVNLPDNIGNLKRVNWLDLEGTAIEVLPSSVGRLAALSYLSLKNCKNLVCLPSTICNLKRVGYLILTGCSKITNLPENLGNMENLSDLFLDGTAIKELPSSTIHLKRLNKVSFEGCQLSSSSLTSMPRSKTIDLSDCNLSAIPSGIDRFSRTELQNLYLMGNDFVSLPESISQFSRLEYLYLDGCKSLRSLSNIPSRVYHIYLGNCTSLERLPEPPIDFFSFFGKFTVQCFNCFKLAYNIQTFSNIFQGQSSQQFEKCYIIPGREIPKCFSKNNCRFPKTPGCFIDEKGFHQVELEIVTQGGVEVEKIGFRVV